jgi:predicted DNA-binding transcriptional regulator AlpA
MDTSGDERAIFGNDERILSESELLALTGLSKTTRWRERKLGRFPPLIELSPGRKANTLGQIREWQRRRQTSAEFRMETSRGDHRGPGRPRKHPLKSTVE